MSQAELHVYGFFVVCSDSECIKLFLVSLCIVFCCCSAVVCLWTFFSFVVVCLLCLVSESIKCMLKQCCQCDLV